MKPIPTAFLTSANVGAIPDISPYDTLTMPRLRGFARWYTGKTRVSSATGHTVPDILTEAAAPSDVQDLIASFFSPRHFEGRVLRPRPVPMPPPTTLFARLTPQDATYLEVPTQSATIKDVDDPLFDRTFVTAFRPLLADIAKLGDLPSRWDSYDGSAVEDQTRLDAIRFLRVLNDQAPGFPTPEVFASPRAGVVFRWAVGGKDVEAEIASDGVRYFSEQLGVDRRRRYGEFGPEDLGALAAAVVTELA